MASDRSTCTSLGEIAAGGSEKKNYSHACRSIDRFLSDLYGQCEPGARTEEVRSAAPAASASSAAAGWPAEALSSEAVAEIMSGDLEVPLAAGQVNKGPASTVTDAALRWFNVAGLVLHFVQGTMMLVASQVVENIKAFKKMLTMSYLRFDEDTQSLVPDSRILFNVEIGVAAAVFVLLSAVAHAIVLICWDTCQ
eukprot:COSAG05_NODE_267_length_12595_cov_7.076905_9_plen_195_part_00